MPLGAGTSATPRGSLHSNFVSAVTGPEQLYRSGGTAGSRAVLVDLLVRCGRSDASAFSDFFDITAELVLGWATFLSAGAADAEALTLRAYQEMWRQSPRFEAPAPAVMRWLADIVVRQRAPAAPVDGIGA
jgi:hypothetical protein